MRECVRVLTEAINADPAIITTRDLIMTHPGNIPENLGRLGLTKQHLRRLERMGLAIRAYTKNIWLPGESAPDGKEIKKGMTARGRGHRVRWLLFAPEAK